MERRDCWLVALTLAIALAPGLGCEVEPTDGGATVGDTDPNDSTGSGGTGSMAQCHDFDADGPEFESLQCDSPQPCGFLNISDPSLNKSGSGEVSFEEPANAICIMEGLRDALPGEYAMAVENGQQYSLRYELEVFADTTVLLRNTEYEDKSISRSERWYGLKDSAYFEGCLALTTDEEQLACFLDAGDAVCVESNVCP